MAEPKKPKKKNNLLPLWLVLAMLLGMVLMLLVLQTPLKTHLPGLSGLAMRSEIVRSNMRLDSLERENEMRMAYLENVMQILREEHDNQGLVSYDSAAQQMKADTLMPASALETSFVERYEAETRFGLDVSKSDAAAAALVFLSPVKGAIQADTLCPVGNEGVRILLKGDSPVMAPAEGTVVAMALVVGDGWQITLQHTGDYVTVLSHISKPMVDRGDVVKAGRVIGHAGDAKSETDRWLRLQVWHKGKSVDPTSFIQF